jgi:hypothetical protein
MTNAQRADPSSRIPNKIAHLKFEISDFPIFGAALL